MSISDVSEWIVRRAARGAPELLAPRLEEEWLADLEARLTTLSRLRFALGCCWARQVIAHELAVTAPPASAAVAGDAVLFGREPPALSRRSATFLLVAVLHVIVLYEVIVTLGAIHSRPKPILPSEVQVIEKAPPPPTKLLPQTVASVAPPTITVTPPELLPIADDPDDSKYAVSHEDAPPSVAPPQEQKPMINRLPGGPGAGFPATQDYYPSAARFAGEQGSVIVRVCADADGRLSGDPTVETRSPYSRLDEGAIRLARAGSGHYRPNREDGRAVNGCFPLKIVFRLTN